MSQKHKGTTHGVPWFAIGIQGNKTPANLGSLFRSAVCMRAAYVFTIGRRYDRVATDTLNAPAHVPCFNFPTLDNFLRHRPLNAPIVGVELGDNTRRLESFTHPRRAIYLLGPEDGSLSKRAQEECTFLVEIDTVYCLNVATAGAVVMYDRQRKILVP